MLACKLLSETIPSLKFTDSIHTDETYLRRDQELFGNFQRYLADDFGEIHSVWQKYISQQKIRLDGYISMDVIKALIQSDDQSWKNTGLSQLILSDIEHIKTFFKAHGDKHPITVFHSYHFTLGFFTITTKNPNITSYLPYTPKDSISAPSNH